MLDLLGLFHIGTGAAFPSPAVSSGKSCNLSGRPFYRLRDLLRQLKAIGSKVDPPDMETLS
jgi:hypothetical protein